MSEQLLEKTITVRQAAEAANVNPLTIYRWIWRGLLPARRTPTGRYRILPEDLKEAVNGDSQEKLQS